MKIHVRWVALLAAVVLTESVAATAAAQVPAFDHIFVIMMSSQPYSSIIGSSSAPYINSLANQYGLATNYFAASQSSIVANNLYVTGGDTFGVIIDCLPTLAPPAGCPISAPNIAVDRIEPSGRTWRAYMESMGTPCNLADSGRYLVRHDPFVYFNDIGGNSAECSSHVVDLGLLSTDLSTASTTPSYVFIAPDVCDDMSQSCAPTNDPVLQGDQWLQAHLPTILNSPAYTTQSSLVFLLWDRDDTTGNNRVPAVLIAKNVRPGYHSNLVVGHGSVLSTIDLSWGFTALTANVATANPMSDFFVAPAVPAARPWSYLVLVGLLGVAAAVRIPKRPRRPQFPA
jgi:acid phosphatase